MRETTRRTFLEGVVSMALYPKGFIAEIGMDRQNIERGWMESISPDTKKLLEPVLSWEDEVRKMIDVLFADKSLSLPRNIPKDRHIRRILLLILSESKGNPAVNDSSTGAIGLMQTLPQIALSYLCTIDPLKYYNYAQMTPAERWSKVKYDQCMDLIGKKNTNNPIFWLQVGVWAYLVAYKKYDDLTQVDIGDQVPKDIAVHRLATISYHAGDKNANMNIKNAFFKNPRYKTPQTTDQATNDAFSHAQTVIRWDSDPLLISEYVGIPYVQSKLLEANGEMSRLKTKKIAKTSN